MKKPKIAICVNYANYQDDNKLRWQRNALEVLALNAPSSVDLCVINFKEDKVEVPARFEVVRRIHRNSKKSLNNTRPLPYIKDLLNVCVSRPCDIFGYLNSDILVKPDFFDRFDKRKIGAFLFSRFDISDICVADFQDNREKVIWDGHPGFDGIFFRKDWWQKYRTGFDPGMILGEPEWDFYYCNQIKQRTRRYFAERVLYHVFHPTIWTLDSPGAEMNRRINGTLR